MNAQFHSACVGALCCFALLGNHVHAQPKKKPAIPENVIFEPGIEFANPDGQHLQLDMARPKSSGGLLPAVVCIHGGGFRAGSRQGYDGLCVRLAPKCEFPAAVHDVKEAVRWLRGNAKKLNVDRARVGVMGGSAGGHLSQFLGVTAHVKSFEGSGVIRTNPVACNAW
jgi:acetyl esterase/lipase